MLALIPLVYLVIRASEAGGGQIMAILLRERTFALIGRSLAFAMTVTAASVVAGVGLAVLVARTDLPDAFIRDINDFHLALPNTHPDIYAQIERGGGQGYREVAHADFQLFVDLRREEAANRRQRS